VGDNDVTLSFGFVEDPANPESLEEEVGVVMTPRTLKILAHNLKIVLDLVERQSGEISVPKEKMGTADDLFAAGNLKSSAPETKPQRAKSGRKKT